MELCQDFSGRTCLMFSRVKGKVTFSQLDIAGLRIQVEFEGNFDARFKAIPDYPAKKAATKFLKIASEFGATKVVLERLAEIIKVPKAMLKQAQANSDARKSNKGPSAAEMFRELILEGSLKDEEIFKQVQKAFDLPESRRAYVKWYRKQLISSGQLKES